MNMIVLQCISYLTVQTLCLVFTLASQVLAVEQFGMQRWKAIENTNLIMVSKQKLDV